MLIFLNNSDPDGKKKSKKKLLKFGSCTGLKWSDWDWSVMWAYLQVLCSLHNSGWRDYMHQSKHRLISLKDPPVSTAPASVFDLLLLFPLKQQCHHTVLHHWEDEPPTAPAMIRNLLKPSKQNVVKHVQTEYNRVNTLTKESNQGVFFINVWAKTWLQFTSVPPPPPNLPCSL